MPDWLLTTRDCAEALGVTRRTAHRLIVLGFLPCARQWKGPKGRTVYRVALSELLAFVEAQGSENPAAIAARVEQRMKEGQQGHKDTAA